MAHFRGILQGSRGAVSRLGGRLNGIYASLNSWTHTVQMRLKDEDWKDIVIVSLPEGLKFYLPTGAYVIKNKKLRRLKI